LIVKADPDALLFTVALVQMSKNLLLQCRKLIAMVVQKPRTLKPYRDAIHAARRLPGKEVMNVLQMHVSRRSMTFAAVFFGLVSLGLAAHAALNRSSDDTTAAATQVAAGKNTRLALVIGNGHYPDAASPLAQPINDARALTAALRRGGFEVDVVEDATRDDMTRAVDRLKAKIKPESVVLLYFGGFGVQVGRQSYLLPIDAAIWREADVRRDGLSVEELLDVMKERGAQARLAVIDASRRNPYERRFRGYSRGLAPIAVPDNALILSSATPGKVADDAKGSTSLLVTELLKNLDAPDTAKAGAEAVFTKTRLAVTRASGGEQVPAVSSSLVEELPLGAASAVKAGS
jgi:hypothetical protein